ncbi:MAG TPA: DegV family protein [Mycobacteriales bacterium]|jgi:DegV family protein with EDD domain
MSVTVVTDSSAYLPAELAAAADLTVVPLYVRVGSLSGVEGVDVTPADVARALGERRVDVSTSRPSPADFVAAYRRVLDGGASGVVSVHLSRHLSGTYESATLAARQFPRGAVRVVDSRSTAMGLGFAVLAAAEVAAEGGSVHEVQLVAEACAARTTTLFCVDTLEHLRRGGRIGAAAALIGTALAVKPILEMVDGVVVVKERVRTSGRALARLEELAVEAAGEGPVDVAVHHLDAADRAGALHAHLAASLGERARLVVSELGAAVGAHVGPGVVGVVVLPRT